MQKSLGIWGNGSKGPKGVSGCTRLVDKGDLELLPSSLHLLSGETTDVSHCTHLMWPWMASRASCMLGKTLPTDPHPKPLVSGF